VFQEKQKLAAKMLKSRMNDVYRLRSLKKAIEKREGATIEMRRKKQLAKKDESFRTKRLGRLSYLDAEIDVQLSSEITGALRSLKCEGSLARDRYKSLQKRNIIEPRERIRSHRKYKLKVKEKRSKRLPEEIGASYFHSRK
jgi:nucleolar protein 53